MPPAARFAIETALLELEALRRGVSLAEVLAGPAPATAPSRSPRWRTICRRREPPSRAGSPPSR
jgi:hypothetical protein